MIEQRHRTAIIIGAMKAGTTSLFAALSALLRVAPSRPKDTKYFLAKEQGGFFWRGMDWYCKQFTTDAMTTWRVEASTHYAKRPDYLDVPRRISESGLAPKLIYAIRNPVERAISHFFHNLVVDGSVADIDKEFSSLDNKYVYYSDYAFQLKPYLNLFDRKDLLVADFIEPNELNNSIAALDSFLDLGGELSKNEQECVTKENTLKRNVYRRMNDGSRLFSQENEDGFRRLVHELAAAGNSTGVEVALRCGLKQSRLDALAEHLEQKVSILESLVSIIAPKWSL